tara:strand:+ start:699 stop:899 length:201 start_codon:yes stop_codon:yes gene_type:complete
MKYRIKEEIRSSGSTFYVQNKKYWFSPWTYECSGYILFRSSSVEKARDFIKFKKAGEIEEDRYHYD